MKQSTAFFSLALTLLLANHAAAQSSTGYCWKDTYTRGVGTIPVDCSANEERQGLLCYPKCPSGYSGAGPVCWQTCPAGFTDNGAFCLKPEPYGRGWGYAWQIEDGLSNSGMLSRCQQAEGVTCEMWGAMAYPKCKSGYTAVGSNICSPVCQGGMTDIGISCAKNTATRATNTASCGTGKDYDAGLCYDACKAGYDGVGPVCWGTCPADKPYACGMGCAVDANTCAQVTSDQVLSVVSTAASIALTAVSGGAGGTLIQAAKMGAKTAVKEAGKQLAKGITKEAVKGAIKGVAKQVGKDVAESTLETWGTALVTYDLTSAAYTSAGQDPPDFDLTSLDPTGISSIVMAYNYPKCAPPATGTVKANPTIPAATTSMYDLGTSAWIQFPGPKPREIAVTGGGTAWLLSDERSATSEGNVVYRIRPGENSWTPIPALGLKGIAAASDYVWGIDGRLNVVKWNGNGWDPAIEAAADDIAVDTNGDLYVMGRNATLFQLKLGADVWTAIPTPQDAGLTPYNIRRIYSNTGGQIFAIDTASVLFQRAGGNWQRISAIPGQGPTVMDVAVDADGKTYRLQNDRKIYPPGSSTPLAVPSSTWSPISMAMGGNSRLWVVGADGLIFKYIGVKN